MATSHSLLMTFLGVVGSSHRDLFDSIDGVFIEVLVCFSDLFFLLSSLSYPLFTYYNDERGERENKKKVMGANQNSDDDTISTIKKISMRQIQ